MSEYQYIAFRAIDAPVSKKNLEFMRNQSSRAEVTPWSFKNEYHFGDFHGNAEEMLRRGYDFHFHYANFGYRTLMFRLPNGLPDSKAAKPYLKTGSLHFVKDKAGPGGILAIAPSYESGQLDEIWDFDDWVERLLPLRAEIQTGDLRPFYLAHLAISMDMNHDPDEERDAPVPAGLNTLTKAQGAFAELYELSDALIAAAASNNPPMPEQPDSAEPYAAWLASQSAATKDAWLSQLMEDPHTGLRAEILAAYQTARTTPAWSTVLIDRTVGDIRTASEAIQQQMDRKRKENAARARVKKLADMVADPAETIRETDELVRHRSGQSYEKIAMLLSDLRSALSLTSQSHLASQQAWKLKEQNPTLKLLISALKRKGFLEKP